MQPLLYIHTYSDSTIFLFLGNCEMTRLGATTVAHTNDRSVHDITMMSMVDMADKETPLVNMENHLM